MLQIVLNKDMPPKFKKYNYCLFFFFFRTSSVVFILNFRISEHFERFSMLFKNISWKYYLWNIIPKIRKFLYFSFQVKLPDIFKDIHETYIKIDSRLKAEQFKVCFFFTHFI